MIGSTQKYDINLDSDRDGIVDKDDRAPYDFNVPYDSIITLTACAGDILDT